MAINKIQRVHEAPVAPRPATSTPISPKAPDTYQLGRPGLSRLAGGVQTSGAALWKARGPAIDSRAAALLSKVTGATPEELTAMRPALVSLIEKIAGGQS